MALAVESPIFKFTEVGSSVAGRIVKIDEVQQRKFQSEELAFWPDGSPKMADVLTLEQEPGNEESRIRLFIGSKLQRKSFLGAMVEAGRRVVTLGDDVRQTWVGLEGAAHTYDTQYSAN